MQAQIINKSMQNITIKKSTININNILKKVTPKIWINGGFRDAISKKTFPVIDPRTGKKLIEVAEGDKADIDEAVKAAREAFDKGPWPKMSGRARGKILMKFADIIEQNLEDLANLETLNNGKPLKDSIEGDVPGTISHIRYYAGWADKIQGKTIPVDGSYFTYTLHEPIGVIGQIIPWNFPLLMAAWKIAPALACGNAVILKVAEQTPLTALCLGEMASDAGIPPGILNIIPGYGPTAGAALVQHKNVDKICFTGSTEVGREIMKNAADTIKNVSLELGGKSPLIVCHDYEDLKEAVEIAYIGAFLNHGQNCSASGRLFVHADIYDEFVKLALDKINNSSNVGDPFLENVDQGPQIDEVQFNKILDYIEIGKKEGAKLVCGGHKIGNEGYYIEKTIFADVNDTMKIAQEEIFGPVMSILKFDSYDDVIERANDTSYGLAAGIISNDVNLINKLSRAIKAGTIWVNCYEIGDDAIPFGGYKMSGFGRDKGEYALNQYTEVKSVVIPLKNSSWL